MYLYRVFRAIIFSIFFLVWTFFLSLFVVLFGLFKRQDIVNHIIQIWVRPSLAILQVQTKIFGEQNIPKDKGVLFLINHQSNLDILIFHKATPVHCRFGAKSELFKIPFFGPAMRASGALEIARDNRHAVQKVYDLAMQRFANHESFILAPEGTRSPSPEIRAFKKGPFHFAFKAQAPIVPVVIVGAYEIMSKKDWLPGLRQQKPIVELHYLPMRLPPQTQEEITSWMESVHQDFVTTFNQRHPKLG